MGWSFELKIIQNGKKGSIPPFLLKTKGITKTFYAKFVEPNDAVGASEWKFLAQAVRVKAGLIDFKTSFTSKIFLINLELAKLY